MKTNETKKKKIDRSEKMNSKLSLNKGEPHFSSKNNKIFDLNDNEFK